MKIIERIVFIAVAPIGVAFACAWLMTGIAFSVLMLPIAVIKFIFTGRFGADWWIDDGPLGWMIMNCPYFLWLDRLFRNKRV